MGDTGDARVGELGDQGYTKEPGEDAGDEPYMDVVESGDEGTCEGST